MEVSTLGVETNFDMIAEGEIFPHIDFARRTAKYRLAGSRFDGTYADNKVLIVKDNSGNEKRLHWKIIKLNKFKLYTNRMDSLIFNRDPIIKVGDAATTKLAIELIKKSKWLKGIRKALRNMEKYGDGPIKTYSGGVSAFSPINAFKVVDENDRENVIAYVLVEYIKDKKNTISYVRFETHLKGYVYERVYKYNGSILGKSIRYKYKDRVIPANGATYATGIDEFMIQWLSCDVDEEGVYGQSPYEDFACLVHEAERRQTLECKILDAHSEPMLAVGIGFLRENETTGKVESFDILGNIIEVANGQQKPEYITWDGKLDASDKMIDLLFSEIYEATELGKTFMTGEYTGNISDETLNSLVKSATDKASRHVWDIYYEIVKSLYVLCRLNGIDVKLEDINVVFQVGQSDGIKTIAEVVNSRVQAGTLSVQTALQRYDAFSEEQALEELSKIKAEKGGV